MRSSVAQMLYDSLKRGDPLDADWFWEAGIVSARDGTPLDIVIWNAVREMLAQQDPESFMKSEAHAVVMGDHLSI